MSRIVCKTVTVSLPEWFGCIRFGYQELVYYEPGHAWAGQVKQRSHGNHHDDALFEHFNSLNILVKELCTHPFSKWVTFETDLSDKVILDRVHEFLRNLSRRKSDYV